MEMRWSEGEGGRRGCDVTSESWTVRRLLLLWTEIWFDWTCFRLTERTSLVSRQSLRDQDHHRQHLHALPLPVNHVQSVNLNTMCSSSQTRHQPTPSDSRSSQLRPSHISCPTQPDHRRYASPSNHRRRRRRHRRL